MSTRTTAGRHRADRRPVTPITGMVAAVGKHGRRAAAAAVTGGIAISTVGAGSAMAAPADVDAAPVADLAGLSNQARVALSTAPTTLTVSTKAKVAVEKPKAVEVTPAPVAVVESVAADARTGTASRSADRTARPAAEASSKAVPAAVAGSSVLSVAAQFVGVPYVYGGTTPAGFDCSGFVQYVYAQLGISLPRTDAGQRAAGTVVSRANAQPGDIIWTPGHVAIYAGGNQMIDAPRPGKSIQFRAIWQSNPTFVRIG